MNDKFPFDSVAYNVLQSKAGIVKFGASEVPVSGNNMVC